MDENTPVETTETPAENVETPVETTSDVVESTTEEVPEVKPGAEQVTETPVDTASTKPNVPTVTKVTKTIIELYNIQGYCFDKHETTTVEQL